MKISALAFACIITCLSMGRAEALVLKQDGTIAKIGSQSFPG